MYRAILNFTDLQDDNFRYNIGDEYPRLGLKPSLARINELLSSDNRRKQPVIEEINEDMPFSDDAVSDEDLATEEKPVDEPTEEKPKRGRKPTKK